MALPFMPWDRKKISSQSDLTPGDAIAVKIGAPPLAYVWHWGLYVGNARVIHNQRGDGVCEISFGAFESLADDEDESVYRVLVPDSFSKDEVVRRAKNKLGSDEYNLLVNNCEHFVVECKTGKHKSHQINTWATITAGILLAPVSPAASSVLTTTLLRRSLQDRLLDDIFDL